MCTFYLEYGGTLSRNKLKKSKRFSVQLEISTTWDLIMVLKKDLVKNPKNIDRLGEKFVVVGGGGRWLVLKPILVFSLSLSQAEQLYI